MINIYYKFYDKTVDIEEKPKILLSINEQKIERLAKIKVYWQEIQKLYNNGKFLNEEICDKLNNFIFLLDAPDSSVNFENVAKNFMIKEKILKQISNIKIYKLNI